MRDYPFNSLSTPRFLTTRFFRRNREFLGSHQQSIPLIERCAQLALADADEPMELPGGPTSYRSTGRRVLQRLENMLTSRVDGTRVLPENVDVPFRILVLLDLDVEIYEVSEAK